MKSIDTTEEQDTKIYTGNGVSLRINDKAFKMTLNYKHAKKEVQEKIREMIEGSIFDLIKDFLLVDK